MAKLVLMDYVKLVDGGGEQVLTPVICGLSWGKDKRPQGDQVLYMLAFCG